jgi:predicted RNase H-like HicB family nuclease
MRGLNKVEVEMKKSNEKIIMVIEKTETGFSAYSQTFPIFTTGKSIPELMNNSLEAVSLYFEGSGKEIIADNIRYEIEFKQFFNIIR